MIIDGKRATLLKSEYVSEPCPNCGAHNSIQISVYQRYVHRYWIPFCPLGKTGISICSNCQQTLKLKDMPTSLKLSYENIKLQTRTPLWTFSGFGIIAVIIAVVLIIDHQNTQKKNQLALAPKVGDILKLELSDTVYTLEKVTHVDKDSVYMVFSTYQTNKEDDLDNLKAKGFDTVEYVVSKAKLIDMSNKDQIIGIDRD